MIRSFSSAAQRRRRSTVEIISPAMCLSILSHVLKHTMLHPNRRYSASRRDRSRGRTLTENAGRSHFQDRSPGSISQRSVAAAGEVGTARLHDHELLADGELAERSHTRLVQRPSQYFGTALVIPTSSS